jgi:alpha-beta hydrolase superfamily lysophospholipase
MLSIKNLKVLSFPLLVLLLSVSLGNAQSKVERQRKSLQKQIFPGARLAANYHFNFSYLYEEQFITAQDGKKLNALLFKADSSKGLIFYLHGNNGALNKWGKIAETYTKLHYDLFILDYRGYGKSEGEITSEEQLYSDVQEAYNMVKARYPEDHIIIMGYSMGTGPAAWLASNNHPKKIILDAPYYSLPDAIHHLAARIDTAAVPYQFSTYQFLQKTTAPVIIFHGDADKVFYYGSSEKLKVYFKPGDQLITLKGASHFDFENNKDYLEGLGRIL